MGKYEDTLEDIRKTLGEEMYLERARYMLSTDEMLEEILAKAQITESSRVGRVCCGVLIDTGTAPAGEHLFVCGDNCRKLVEMASE